MKRVIRKANGVSRIIRADYKGGRFKGGWNELVDRVRERDGDRCVKCRRTRKELNALGLRLETNHVLRVSLGGKDTARNLQCECSECHPKNPKHGHMRKQKKLKAYKAKQLTKAKGKILGYEP